MPTLLSRVSHWRAVGDRIVFTNGCFDIVHPGHIELLAACRDLGDHVVVGLNSDASVRRLKGAHRPVNDQLSRAVVLAGLSFIDAIIIFEEDTPLELITQVRPDILVKGGDYTIAEIAGADLIIQNGGEVRIIPLMAGYSTTSIITRANS
jgi:rfaE bifunctional protein nucleotidyltransferase chain/domain